MISLLVSFFLTAFGAQDSVIHSMDAPANGSTAAAAKASAPLRWQVGLGGGVPQLGGVMVRCWWDARNGVEIRGHARAKRENFPVGGSSNTNEYADSGYSATGEFSLDAKVLRQLFFLMGDQPTREVLIRWPIHLRGLAYLGAGGYFFYEDRESKRLQYKHVVLDPETGVNKMESVYRSESIHQRQEIFNLVGGGGFEAGYGRLSANMLVGYGWASSTNLKQYELAPSFDFGIALDL